MPDNAVQIRVTSDLSKIKAQFENLGGSASGAFTQAAVAAEPLDKALVGNRETARLLAEELGLRLPRAVTHAIGEMIPNIASFGTVLLGAFAVKEAISFGEALEKVADDIQGVAFQAELAKLAFQEEGEAMIELAHRGEDDARLALKQTNDEIAMLEARRAGRQAELEVFKARGPIMEAEALLVAKLSGASKEAQEDDKREIELIRQRDELRKILTEDANKGYEKAAAGLEKQQKATEQAAKAAEHATAAMAALIQKELDEGAALDVRDDKHKQALAHYDQEVRSIEAQVEAARRAGTLTTQLEEEADRAKLLARANLAEKGRQIDAEEIAAAQKKNQTLLVEQQQFTQKMIAEAAKVQAHEEGGVNEAAVRRLTEAHKQYMQVLGLEPAILAAIARAYPGITMAQAAALPGITQFTQAVWAQEHTMQSLLSTGVHVFDELGRSVQGYSGVAMRALGQIVAAVVTEMEAQIAAGAAEISIQDALMQNELVRMEVLAVKHAMKCYAQGMEDLADMNYWGAALEFAAMAAWGALAAAPVAAIAASAGAFSGGGGAGAGRGTGASAAAAPYGGGPGGGGGGGAGGGGSYRGSGVFNVNIIAPNGGMLIGTMQDLATLLAPYNSAALSRGVIRGDFNLTAYNAIANGPKYS